MITQDCIFRQLKNGILHALTTVRNVLLFPFFPGRTERKMSRILKEMAKTLLKDPGAIPSSEAQHAALLLSHVAWNRAIGEAFTDSACREVLRELEKSRPSLWNEFATNNWKSMVGDLIRYKKIHHPDDTRVVVVCGIRDPGVVRVEWRYRDEPSDI